MYTMLNMGSYVGNKSREWYEESPEVWKLMFLNEKAETGERKHIEALVDDRGDYIRLLVDSGGSRRVIQLSQGKVYSDIIVEKFDNDGMSGNSYVALDGDILSTNMVPLDEYLATPQKFVLDDKPYTGPLTDNSSIIDFISKGEELLTMVNSDSISEMSL